MFKSDLRKFVYLTGQGQYHLWGTKEQELVDKIPFQGGTKQELIAYMKAAAYMPLVFTREQLSL